MIQASCFEDIELHKKYNFCSYLQSYLKVRHPGGGFDLTGKIKANNFVQKQVEEHKKSKIKSDPIVKLPMADQIVLPPQKRNDYHKSLMKLIVVLEKNMITMLLLKPCYRFETL